MNIVTRTVERLGFVRTSRYLSALEHQRKAEARSAEVLREVDELRSSARGWKAKANGLAQALKQARDYGKQVHREAERTRSETVDVQRDARRAQRDAIRTQSIAARRIQQLERAAERAGKTNERLHTKLELFAERLAAAERDLTVARQNLMAVEVKLDILEGAASVLDRRTRVDLQPQTGAGAAV